MNPAAKEMIGEAKKSYEEYKVIDLTDGGLRQVGDSYAHEQLALQKLMVVIGFSKVSCHLQVRKGDKVIYNIYKYGV